MENQKTTKWKPFLLTGGLSAFAYSITAIFATGAMTLSIDQDIIGVDALGGEQLLQFIAENTLFWIILQTLVLETSIFLILTFIALFLVLRDGKPSLALAGAVVGVTSQILFMSYYPMLMGLVFLGDNYAASDPSRQQALATASEGLIAMVNAFNPAYEALLAVGIVLVSAAFPGSPLRKWLSSFGYLTGGIALTAILLFPFIGYWYLWWWGAFVVWVIGIGAELVRIARL